MPFKSLAQMNAAFGGYLGPEMEKKAPEWAAKTQNIKKLPQHAKKEGMHSMSPLDNLRFWVVKKPVSYQSSVKDICTQVNPFEFSELERQGLAPDQVAGFYMEAEEAEKKAKEMLMELYETAKALEEKKQMVSEKLHKTIEELQKKVEEAMKMVKNEPEKAEKYHEIAEGLMTRIKELRGTHKKVEGSKKELVEMSYDESGLEHPKKADRNKDKKISKYEKVVGKAIEKSKK